MLLLKDTSTKPSIARITYRAQISDHLVRPFVSQKVLPYIERPPQPVDHPQEKFASADILKIKLNTEILQYLLDAEQKLRTYKLMLYSQVEFHYFILLLNYAENQQ